MVCRAMRGSLVNAEASVAGALDPDVFALRTETTPVAVFDGHDNGIVRSAVRALDGAEAKGWQQTFLASPRRCRRLRFMHGRVFYRQPLPCEH
jgi:hypothetical protein